MTTPSPLVSNQLDSGPNILGIIFGGHDTSAALMVNGEVIAACEQERYSLDKHSRRFPSDAINDCLQLGQLQMRDIDEIAFGIDPIYYIRETYLRSALVDDARIGFMLKDMERIQRLYDMEKRIREHDPVRGSNHVPPSPPMPCGQRLLPQWIRPGTGGAVGWHGRNRHRHDCHGNRR